MHITVVGVGYVGLVTGACLADFGHSLTCVDQDSAKISTLKAGRVPFFEPGLESIVHANTHARRLRFTTALVAARKSDVVMLAVGTPSRRGDGYADLSYVFDAVRSLASELSDGCVLVIKSTVPVGTADEVECLIGRLRPTAKIAVVSNPEFLREGAAIQDFKHPDRVVVGTSDLRARAVMGEVYRPLYLNATPIQYTSRRSAELIKYATNAFLAAKIAFINEIADLAEKAGADVQDVARGIGLDNRIGSKFLHPGPGYGGSCFPKDTLALLRTGQDFGVPLRIVETVVTVNDARKRTMAQRVVAALGGVARNKTVAVLGLTFKPNTDDMREAPSIPLIIRLLELGANVRAYDPAGMKHASDILPPGVTYCEDPYIAAQGSDVLVIVTEWEQFRALDFRRLKRSMVRAVVVDMRNVYQPEELVHEGFVYHSIGRPIYPTESYLNSCDPPT